MSAGPKRTVMAVLALAALSCTGEPTGLHVDLPGVPAVSTAEGTITWDGGAGNGLWSDPVNWVGDVLPSASADLVIPNSATPLTVHIDGPVTIDRTLSMGGNVTLEVDAGQTLTVNGTVSASWFPAAVVVNYGTIAGSSTGFIRTAFRNEATGVVGAVRVEIRSNAVNRGTMDGTRVDFGNAGGYVFENFAAMTNPWIRIRDSYIAVHPRFVNRPGGTITGGAIEVGGPVNSSGFRDYGDLTNEGTITGANIDVYERFDNAGTVDISASGRLKLAGDEARLRFGEFANAGTFTGTLTADYLVWDGGGDGSSWSDPLNWNVDRAPGAGGITSGVLWRKILVLTSETSDVTVHLDVDQELGFASGLVVQGRTNRTATLTVDAAKTLNLSDVGSELSVYRGVLRNEGTVIAAGRADFGRFELSGIASVTNNGTMTLKAGSFVRPQATFTNTGTLQNHGPMAVDGVLANSGSIDNPGTIKVSCSGSYGASGTVTGNAVELLCGRWDGGAGNGLWSDPVNWVGDVLPSASADLVIPNSATPLTVHVDAPVTIERALAMGGNVTLQVDAGQTLTLNGTISGTWVPAPVIVNYGTITGSSGGFIRTVLRNEPSGLVGGVRVEVQSNTANRGTMDGTRLDYGGPLVFENFATMTNTWIRIRHPFIDRHPQFVNRSGATITGGAIEVGGPVNLSGFRDYGDLTNEGTITGANIDVYERFDNAGTVDISASGRLKLAGDEARLRFGQFANTGTFAGTLTADYLVWDGGGDGSSWSDPLNWNVNRAPGAGGITTGVTWRKIFVLTNQTSDVTVHLDVDQQLGVISGLVVRGQADRTATLIVNAAKTLDLSHATSTLELYRGVLRNEGTVIATGGADFGRLEFSAVGSVTNNGAMTLKERSFVRPGVTFQNNGTVDNQGTLDNSGTIRNACGATFNEGTMTGNPVVRVPCGTTPVANAGGPYEVNEGGGVPVAGSGTDADEDPLTFAWDLDGDGVFESAGSSATFSAAGVDGPASRTVAFRACDDDTNCDVRQAIVNVRNVAPVVAVGGPYTVDEGSSVDVGGSATDAGGDALSFSWDLDGDGLFETSGATGSFAGVDGPASPIVRLRVCDDDGACASASTTVQVKNVAPTVIAGADIEVYRNESFELTGSWTDPAGPADAHLFRWADATSDWYFEGEAPFGVFPSVSHSIALEGVHIFFLAVFDYDGGVAEDVLLVRVLNRPPVCTDARPGVATLWPANRQLVDVTIGGVTDAEGDPISITVTGIRQDEPVDDGGGRAGADASGVGTATARLKAERVGGGNGRFYHVQFTAADGHGGECSGVVRVIVPATGQGQAVDDGPLYDSMVPGILRN